MKGNPKRSKPCESGLHRIPQEWADAESAAQDLAEMRRPTWARMRVKLALKGGYMAGYSWAGMMRLTIVPNIYGVVGYHGDCEVHGQWDGEDIDRFSALVERAEKRGVRDFSFGCYVISLYRRGLIPSEAKIELTYKVKQQFGVGLLDVRRNHEQALAAHKALTEWMDANGYKEEINGIYVTPDGRRYDSTGLVTGTIGFNCSEEEPE